MYWFETCNSVASVRNILFLEIHSWDVNLGTDHLNFFSYTLTDEVKCQEKKNSFTCATKKLNE